MSEWGDLFCAFDGDSRVGCTWSNLEAHHIIPRQTIKGQYRYWHALMPQVRADKGMPATLPLLEEALLDRRNLIPLCRRHHELVTNHRIYVTRDMLPEGIYDFAGATGLVWWLERWFEAAA